MNKEQNNNSNLSILDKNILIKKLKKDNINITSEDLEEVINIYNHVIDFCLEDKKASSYKFSFIKDSKILCEYDNTTFLSIFRLLIQIKKHNLFNYLDYVLLINTYCYDGNRLEQLYFYLNLILNGYYDSNKNNDFIYKFIDSHQYLLPDILDNYLNYILDSEYINQDYKDIICLYNELFDLYLEEDYDEIDPEIFFQEFISMSYYYFVINNLFNTEPKEIINFLNNIKEDIPSICDKLNLDGEIEYKERINYIDALYRNKNKVKIIK